MPIGWHVHPVSVTRIAHSIDTHEEIDMYPLMMCMGPGPRQPEFIGCSSIGNLFPCVSLANTHRM